MKMGNSSSTSSAELKTWDLAEWRKALQQKSQVEVHTSH